jgi:hypothetical protein
LQDIQVSEKFSDIKHMISSVSTDSSLAVMATGMQNANVQSEISIAIMKQVQNQQDAFANALLEMIKQGPMPDGTGQVINIAA